MLDNAGDGKHLMGNIIIVATFGISVLYKYCIRHTICTLW
jgi:hypothetical protein